MKRIVMVLVVLFLVPSLVFADDEPQYGGFYGSAAWSWGVDGELLGGEALSLTGGARLNKHLALEVSHTRQGDAESVCFDWKCVDTSRTALLGGTRFIAPVSRSVDLYGGVAVGRYSQRDGVFDDCPVYLCWVTRPESLSFPPHPPRLYEVTETDHVTELSVGIVTRPVEKLNIGVRVAHTLYGGVAKRETATSFRLEVGYGF